MTDTLVNDKLLIHAARIANKFQQDVISILRSPAHEWLMWDAAFRVVQEDEREHAERVKANSRKK